MDISTKRQEIVDLLNDAINNDDLSISYSSPKIKSAKCFYIKKSKEKPKFIQPVMKTAEDDMEHFNPPPAPLPVIEDVKVESAKEFEKQEPETLTYKELKQKQKEELKQSKQYNKSRKDLHKRGFDTGILKELDNPEDVYDLTDDEIAQIEIAGYINKDGYYTFVYPRDIAEAQEEGISGKRFALILGCLAVSLLIVWKIISNVMNFL